MNAQLKNRTAMVIMVAALSANAMVNIGLYEWFGAITLGLGNTAYGIVLLIGTLLAFGLIKNISAVAIFCGLGVV